MALLDGLLGGGIFGGGTAKAAENLANPKSNAANSTSNNKKSAASPSTSNTGSTQDKGTQDKGLTVTPLYQSTSGNKNTRTYRVTDNNTGKSTQTAYANIDAAGLIDYYTEKGQTEYVTPSLQAIAQYEADNKNTPGSESGTYYDAFSSSGTLVDRSTGIKSAVTAPSQTVYLSDKSGTPTASNAPDTYTGQRMPTFGDLGKAIGDGMSSIPVVGDIWNTAGQAVGSAWETAGQAVDTVLGAHDSLYESDNLVENGVGLITDIFLPLDLAKTAKKAADGGEVTGWDVFNSVVDIVGLIPGVGWAAKGAVKAVGKTVPWIGAGLNLTLNDDISETPTDDIREESNAVKLLREALNGDGADTPVLPTLTPTTPGIPDVPSTPSTPGTPDTPTDAGDDGDLLAFLAGLITGQSGSGGNSPGGGGMTEQTYIEPEAKSNITQYLPLIAVIGGVVLLGVLASRKEA